ncbi:MAG TPA: hypothetical protein VI703_08620 [Anaerolineales bacterium]|nr:hypothetical protein [Anaerolineales bacterium]
MQTEAIREYYDNEFNRLAAGLEQGGEISEAVLSAHLDPDPQKRIGMHYFPDTKHYNHADLERWLPILQNLGTHWVTLPAPIDRAIPQEFIDALIGSEINPIIHFNASLIEPPSVDEIRPLLQSYASWGVQYVVFFDRPNLRSQWPLNGWTQRGLVTRFLDIYLPLANAAIESGLTPVFPALEPGGDFWDTAFLRAALEALAESGEGTLRESLVLGAYAWTGDKSMTWGAGGPENWPASMPYHTPENSQDQRGFRIFDWYNAISRAVLGKELPIILIAAGVQREKVKLLDAQQGKRAIRMAETLKRSPDPNNNNTVPANVLACNFWLLSAMPETPEEPMAWYRINGKPTRFADEWMAWKKGASFSKTAVEENEDVDSNLPVSPPVETNGRRPIPHYLLLPDSADWPMDLIRTFVLENKATMGISAQEAAKAARVTLAGGLEAFSDELIRNLIQAGCQVDLLPIESAA